MRQRPNLIVILGLAVFVVGAAAAWLVLRDSSTSSAADATSVLVADKPIAAGTTGQAAVAQGLIKVKKIDIKARPATALTDASQLAGKTAHVNIAAGPEDLDQAVRAFEEQMWVRAGRWAKITTAGLERLVSPDPAEALALFDQVQPS